MMSALASTPSTRGWSSAVSSRSSIERRSAIASGSSPRPTIAARRVVGGDDEQHPVAGQRLAAAAAGEGRGDPRRLVRRARRSASRNSPSDSFTSRLHRASISSAVGMASAHISRDGDDRPGGVGVGRPSARPATRRAGRGRTPRRRRRRRRARTRPRPDGAGRPSTPSARRHQHAVGAELDDGRCSTPRASSRRAASSGSAVPTAMAHSARLPMATVAASTAPPMSRRASSGSAHSTAR